jgi:hypothetical protein
MDSIEIELEEGLVTYDFINYTATVNGVTRDVTDVERHLIDGTKSFNEAMVNQQVNPITASLQVPITETSTAEEVAQQVEAQRVAILNILGETSG